MYRTHLTTAAYPFAYARFCDATRALALALIRCLMLFKVHSDTLWAHSQRMHRHRFWLASAIASFFLVFFVGQQSEKERSAMIQNVNCGQNDFRKWTCVRFTFVTPFGCSSNRMHIFPLLGFSEDNVSIYWHRRWANVLAFNSKYCNASGLLNNQIDWNATAYSRNMSHSIMKLLLRTMTALHSFCHRFVLTSPLAISFSCPILNNRTKIGYFSVCGKQTGRDYILSGYYCQLSRYGYAMQREMSLKFMCSVCAFQRSLNRWLSFSFSRKF